MKTRIPLIVAFLVVGVFHLNAAIIPVTSTADSGARLAACGAGQRGKRRHH